MVLQYYSCKPGGYGADSNKKKQPPVLSGHFLEVLPEAYEEAYESARVKRHVESKRVDIPLPVEKPREQDQVGGGADGEELRNALYYAQYYRL